MCFHVIQAHVEASKHVGEFRIPYSIPCTRGIEPPGGRIQEFIVVEVVLNAIRKLGISFLRRQKSLALFLELRCLGFDRSKGFGQAGQFIKEGQGVRQDLIDVFLRLLQVIQTIPSCNKTVELASITSTPHPWHILVLIVALLDQVVFDAIEPLRKLKLIAPTWNAPLEETTRLLLCRLEARLDFGVWLARRTRWRGLTAAALLLRGRHDPVKDQVFEGESFLGSSLIRVRENAGSQS